MTYTIVGEQLPVLTITLGPNEKIVTENESRHLSWLSPDIKKKTVSTSSFSPFFSKLIFGDARVIDVFLNPSKTGVVAFSTTVPSKIKVLELNPTQSWLIKKGSLLAMESTVKCSPATKFNLWDALFGNDDLAMQRLDGSGKAFIQMDASATEYQLGPGETLAFDQSSVAFISGSCRLKAQRTHIFKAFFFGGNDTIRYTIVGPGKVVMQNANYQR